MLVHFWWVHLWAGSLAGGFACGRGRRPTAAQVKHEVVGMHPIVWLPSIGKSGLGDAKAVFWNRASEKNELGDAKAVFWNCASEKSGQPSEQALYK